MAAGMRTATTLHLVAFVPGSALIVVAEAAAGWYLPFTAVNPGHRPCDVAVTLAETLGLTGCLVYEAPIDAAHQASSTRYAAFALFQSVVLPPSWRLRSAETLTDTSAMSPSQPFAIRACLARESRPCAPFDTHRSALSARSWACLQIGIDEPTATIRHLRTNRFDLVLGIGRRGEISAFLKAGPYRVPDEARTAQLLAAVAPNAFPETLGVSRANRYWLTGRLPGEPLSSRPQCRSALLQAVRQLAQIQDATSRSSAARTTLACRAVTPRSLARSALALIRHARNTALRDVPSQSLARAESVITAACTQLSMLDVPNAWLHSDCYGGNILIGTNSAAFIDVDYSFWGPAILSLWRLYSDLAERDTSEDLLNIISDTYVCAWPANTRERLRTALTTLPIVGQTFYLMMLQERARRRLAEIGCSYSRLYVVERLGAAIRDLVAHAVPDPAAAEEVPQHTPQTANPEP